MALHMAVFDPIAILEEGEIDGFEYAIINNGIGYRCGYIRVEPGHPWHGKTYGDPVINEIKVHGRITFGAFHNPCRKRGPDSAWWVGFDCAHEFDERDFSLPFEDEEFKQVLLQMKHLHIAGPLCGTIKDTAYVREQCKSLIKQARRAWENNGESERN